MKHVDRMVAAGTATHVAAFVDDGIILNSQEPFAKVRNINEVSNWYMQNGHEVVVRGLDRAALEKLAAEKKTVNGLDAEFQQFFDIRGAN